MKTSIKSGIKYGILSFSIGIYIGCSEVKFSRDANRCATLGLNCIVQNDKYVFNDSIVSGGGKVDILIVDDNSASMSFEQKNLAARFTDFIQHLEDRYVNYRIAITTTDISDQVADGSAGNSPRAINGSGALQDGNLIKFGNGAKYLSALTKPTNSTDLSNQVNLFNNAIQRPETKSCEQFIADWVASGHNINETAYQTAYYDKCPSGDERGIFAANLVLDKNPDSFLRPDAHLVIIFLSDENVRSNLLTSQQLSGTYDSAGTLVKKFNDKYGNTKTLMSHAIVVSDSTCAAQQSNQALGTPAVAATAGLVKGSIGQEYIAAASSTGGVQGDICANSTNYTNQIGSIITKTEKQISTDYRMSCSSPQDLTVNIQGDSNLSYTSSGNMIKFNKVPDVGSVVSIHYVCSDI